MKNLWLIKNGVVPIVLVALVSCSNPPADVRAAGEPTPNEQRPDSGSDQSNKPITDGKEKVPGRIFCVRGQVKSSLATFSTEAGADVFATSLVFKKNDFPLIDLKEFTFLEKNEDQLTFAILGEETNPSDTSDISKKQNANIVSGRLVNRTSEIIESFPVVEYPSAMVGTLEARGYRLNRFLLDSKNSLRVYGPTKDFWTVEINGKSLLVLPTNEYFSPVVFGRDLYFYKLENGLVSLVKINLEFPEQIRELPLDSELGSVIAFSAVKEGLILVQKSNNQFTLSLMEPNQGSKVLRTWNSTGRVWLNTDFEQVYLVVENEDGQPGYSLSKWATNTLNPLGQLQINGEIKDILTFGEEHFALIKNNGVNRIYRVALNNVQKVISRSECERAWIVKW